MNTWVTYSQWLQETLEMSWEEKDNNDNDKNRSNTLKLLFPATLKAETNLRQDTNPEKVVLWQTNTCSWWCAPELEDNISFTQKTSFRFITQVLLMEKKWCRSQEQPPRQCWHGGLAWFYIPCLHSKWTSSFFTVHFTFSEVSHEYV